MIIEPDRELEDLFTKQPETQFKAVYDRYSGPLFRYLYRFTANSQAAEEILQDIFLELYNGKFKSDQNGSLKSWLFVVAKNRGINFIKKNSKIVRSNIEDLVDENDLELNYINKQRSLKLAEAEKILPIELQETWNLRKSGYDYQQIAEKLSIPIGTVKSRFSRLVEYLKKELQA